MLLQFAVENYLSVRDRAELSMIASSLKDNDRGLMRSEALPGHAVLPCAVIYGANASGKSNLVRAIRRMRTYVLLSHTKGTPDGGVPISPFLLCKDSGSQPSVFEIDFVMDGVRYEYGFKATKEAFIEEWLYSYPRHRRQLLFNRDGQNFSFGRALKGANQTISSLTRPNSLFVSAAAQNDHKILTDVYIYFRDLEINASISSEDQINQQFLKQNEIDPRVIGVLRDIGTGVVSSKKTKKEITEMEKSLRKELMGVFSKFSDSDQENESEDDEEDTEIKIQLGHMAEDGSTVFFDLQRESAGTRRLLMQLQMIFAVLDRGGAVVVDELDASVHTKACEAVLSLFANPESNRNGAQIIATVHDTNLLDASFIRRDEVWFTEKDKSGSTSIFPLTDIGLRKTDNIERGYLQGRFGAIPSPIKVPAARKNEAGQA